MPQKFGGIWTPEKLGVLERYLKFYKTALKNAAVQFGWQLIYIDAFAGSGECFIGQEQPDDIDSIIPLTEAVIDGSARIALNLDNPFDHYFFVEHKKKYFSKLNDYCREHHLSNRIHIKQADANDAIGPLLRSIDWKKSRGVMFLDPYGMQVGCDLLHEIAATEALDVWYLFPLHAIARQAAKNYKAVDSDKEASLNFCLGTDAWKTAFYDDVKTEQLSMFDEEDNLIGRYRSADKDDIIRFVKEEVLERAFPAVSDPRILYGHNNVPQFALFFAVSNPDKTAINRAMEVADYILKMA